MQTIHSTWWPSLQDVIPPTILSIVGCCWLFWSPARVHDRRIWTRNIWGIQQLHVCCGGGLVHQEGIQYANSLFISDHIIHLGKPSKNKCYLYWEIISSDTPTIGPVRCGVIIKIQKKNWEQDGAKLSTAWARFSKAFAETA